MQGIEVRYVSRCTETGRIRAVGDLGWQLPLETVWRLLEQGRVVFFTLIDGARHDLVAVAREETRELCLRIDDGLALTLDLPNFPLPALRPGGWRTNDVGDGASCRLVARGGEP